MRALVLGPAVVASLVAAACGSDPNTAVEGQPRIVTIGGPVTEIVFALGHGAQVVGTDTSSTYPPEVSALPKVGSHQRVSAEAVLALRPTLVLASEQTPRSALEQIEAIGVPTAYVDEVTSADQVGARIRAVAVALGRGPEANELALRAARELADARAPRVASAPRVLFIYARGASVVSVAGTETAAAAMIELAGGINAVTEFDGFRPLSAEAVVAARPDVLLMMPSGAESLDGDDGVFALPGVALTPAGKQRRLIEMDGQLLLGFGPRTGEAVRQLRAALSARDPL